MKRIAWFGLALLACTGPAGPQGPAGSGAEATSGGGQWVLVGNARGDNAEAYLLASNDKFLFAGLRPSGLSRSSDNGVTWESISLADPIIPFAITTSGSKVLAGGCTDSDHSTFHCGVLVSSDDGATWKATAYQGNVEIMGIAVSGADIFVASGDGLSHSSDNGVSWTSSLTGGGGAQGVQSVAVSGSNILAGTLGGMYLSSDGGKNWRRTGAAYPVGRYGIATNESNLLARFEGGLYRSLDNGETWNRILVGTVATMVAVGDDIFAGLDGDSDASVSVLRSSDEGATWMEAGVGLVDRRLSLLIASHGFLLASDGPGNIWRLAVSTTSGN